MILPLRRFFGGSCAAAGSAGGGGSAGGSVRGWGCCWKAPGNWVGRSIPTVASASNRCPSGSIRIGRASDPADADGTIPRGGSGGSPARRSAGSAVRSGRLGGAVLRLVEALRPGRVGPLLRGLLATLGLAALQLLFAALLLLAPELELFAPRLRFGLLGLRLVVPVPLLGGPDVALHRHHRRLLRRHLLGALGVRGLRLGLDVLGALGLLDLDELGALRDRRRLGLGRLGLRLGLGLRLRLRFAGPEPVGEVLLRGGRRGRRLLGGRVQARDRFRRDVRREPRPLRRLTACDLRHAGAVRSARRRVGQRHRRGLPAHRTTSRLRPTTATSAGRFPAPTTPSHLPRKGPSSHAPGPTSMRPRRRA